MSKDKSSPDGLDSVYIDHLYHLSRLALSGKREDVTAYLRKITASCHARGVNVEKLVGLMNSTPTRSRPLNNPKVDHVPVDLDSRLSLLHIDESPVLDIQPVFSETVSKGIETILHERREEKHLLRSGLTPIKTAIFTGPPGVGKTLAAKYLASQLSWPLITLDLAAVMSSFLGKTGQNIRKALDYAKNINCVLLLDEIDAIAKKRADSTEVGELKRLVNVLLQEIDNWPSNGLLIGATNHSELLDPAIWRRFELQIDFPLPDQLALKGIFSEACIGLNVSEEDLRLCSLILAGSTCHEIVQSVRKSHKEAIMSQKTVAECLVQQCNRKVSTLSLPKKKEIAQALLSHSYSQRCVSEITSLSRDTIRKIK